MKRIMLVLTCFVAGCLLGVGVAWASSPMMLPNNCFSYGDETTTDDIENLVCDAHVEVNLQSAIDGGKVTTCPPVKECEALYELDGFWTHGSCVDRVDLYRDYNDWQDGQDIPSGNGGPPSSAPINCNTSCPANHSWELIFMLGTEEVMSLYWETQCNICPGPL